MSRVLMATLLTLFMSTHGLECYYYRIRADETLTPDNMIQRNCSSSTSSCVKIISRIELSQQEQSEAPSTIEGRCAFTKHECADHKGQCTSETPIVRSGITIHEYKCCSGEDLSNEEPRSNSNIVLFTCIVLFSVLYR